MPILPIKRGEEKRILSSPNSLREFIEKHGGPRITLNINYTNEHVSGGKPLLNLASINISGVKNLNHPAFYHVNLSYANFSSISAYDLLVSSSKLRNANFRKAEIEGAHFEYVDLQGVNFSGANLRNAFFKECNLKNVNFRNANLRGARLHECETKGARVDGADFTGARFYQTTLSREDLNKAEGLSRTMCGIYVVR